MRLKCWKTFDWSFKRCNLVLQNVFIIIIIIIIIIRIIIIIIIIIRILLFPTVWIDRIPIKLACLSARPPAHSPGGRPPSRTSSRFRARPSTSQFVLLIIYPIVKTSMA